jgi:hypothetical protein
VVSRSLFHHTLIVKPHTLCPGGARMRNSAGDD